MRDFVREYIKSELKNKPEPEPTKYEIEVILHEYEKALGEYDSKEITDWKDWLIRWNVDKGICNLFMKKFGRMICDTYFIEKITNGKVLLADFPIWASTKDEAEKLVVERFEALNKYLERHGKNIE